MVSEWNPPPPPFDQPRTRARTRRVFRVLLFSLLGILALLGVVFIGLIGWAWLATLDSEDAAERGRTAGVGATDQACLERAISQIEERRPFFLAFYETTFLSECLAVSRATDEFCAGVPEISDQEARAIFNESRCSSVNASRFACYSLFTQVSAHCAQREDRSLPP